MQVAVLGLGKMGQPIARRLLAAGHELAVWNRTPERASELEAAGAQVLSAPRDACAAAEVVMTMLLDDAALLEVTTGADGVLAGAGEGRVLVDMSTVSPEASRRVAEASEQAGVAFLRAPVSGNPSVVEAGNLGIMISGDEDAFRRTEALLRDVGPNVFYVGSGEAARVLKLALNLMIAGNAQIVAEALVLGEAHGLDRATMLEVMGASAVGSPFVKYKTPALVADDYGATFTGRAMWKDLSMALAAAHDVHAPLPVTATIQQLVEGCVGAGWGDLDLMALLPRLRREAGLEPGLP
ncbi:MAG TPA: NAD(P)-dependent oxidoreductase [Gaiellaceae bacterium]|nr:NAD(P)-dependent oxidoreductase [Gaiellaceae bacterium]